jgi:hypothetical protein
MFGKLFWGSAFSSRRGVLGVLLGDEKEEAAGEQGEGPHPEKDRVETDLFRFAGDEALAGGDEASVGERQDGEGDTNAGLRLPGDLVFAALVKGVEDAVGRLGEGAVEGGIAAEGAAGGVVQNYEVRRAVEPVERRYLLDGAGKGEGAGKNFQSCSA